MLSHLLDGRRVPVGPERKELLVRRERVLQVPEPFFDDPMRVPRLSVRRIEQQRAIVAGNRLVEASQTRQTAALVVPGPCVPWIQYQRLAEAV